MRSVLQVYGHMEGGSVYVGAVCYHSELAELSRSTIVMVGGGISAVHCNCHHFLIYSHLDGIKTNQKAA